MTCFLDVPAMSRLVQDVGVSRLLGELADTIRQDFVRWQDFEKCARLTSQSRTGVHELMPVASDDHYAFKYVNCHPENTTSGLFSVMGMGVLADAKTGYPLLLCELTLATALRTSAMSLVAARALARPGARRMALIGNGAQSDFQAVAFHSLFGIDEISVFDVDPSATDKLMRNLSDYRALKIIRADSISQAVRGADIVTTVTANMAHAHVLTPEMIEPGMHINAVGGDCTGKTELHADVLRGARVFVEFEPQTRMEGEIQQLPDDFAVVDLWRVLAGTEAGRQSAEQLTVFDSVGFALEDYSTLRYFHALAAKRCAGVEVELVPRPDDSKDLFRYTRPADVRPTLYRIG